MALESSEGCPSTDPVHMFVPGLLEQGKPRTLGGILEGMVHAFAADGAGVLYPLRGPSHLSQSSWVSTPVESYPWETNPILVDRVRDLGTAVAVPVAGDTRWLLTSIGQHGGRNW